MVFEATERDGTVLFRKKLAVRHLPCQFHPRAAMTSNRTVRQMEDRIRELERQLGRKTLEVEILKEALEKTRSKQPTLLTQSPLRTVPDDGRGRGARRVPFEPA